MVSDSMMDSFPGAREELQATFPQLKPTRLKNKVSEIRWAMRSSRSKSESSGFQWMGMERGAGIHAAVCRNGQYSAMQPPNAMRVRVRSPRLCDGACANRGRAAPPVITLSWAYHPREPKVMPILVSLSRSGERVVRMRKRPPRKTIKVHAEWYLIKSHTSFVLKYVHIMMHGKGTGNAVLLEPIHLLLHDAILFVKNHNERSLSAPR